MKVRVWAAALIAAVAGAGTSAKAFDPMAGDFSRGQASCVRALSYNVEQHFPAGSASQNAAFNRLLTAINPDIAVFQEIDASVEASALQSRLQALLGGTWHVWLGESDSFTRNAICSRYPLSMQRMDTSPASEVRGVACALVDLPDATFHADLYVMAVHLKCCSGAENDDRRQRHADALAKWFGDLRSPGGAINLPANTPALALGDFNFGVGFSTQPHATLMTGNIQDNATFGADIKGDWDGSDLAEVLPADLMDLDFETWPSADGAPSARLDRFYYTDSVLQAVQAFVLNPRSLSSAALAGAGLQQADASTATDHLPIVADFVVAPVQPAEPLYRGVFISEMIADPLGTDSDREWFEVFNPTSAPVDLNGWIIRDQGSNFHRIDAGGPLLLPAKGHLVLGRSTVPLENDGAPVAYAYGSDISLNNATPDELELYRGSIKVDGVRFGGGAAGQGPANFDWGAAPVPGRSRGMTGNYQNGPTASFAEATTFYSASGYGTSGSRGTPGELNDGAEGPPALAGLLTR
jgi:endonuclease/exonuclease/phosphatase family metal-dependent hydrolase